MTNINMENIWKILTENRSIEMVTGVCSDLVCTACETVMIRPCNVPCGCRYCSKCLENYLMGKQKFCLGDSDCCKVELINFDKNVFPDQAANKKISRLIVKCPLESCKVETQLIKLESHLKNCNIQPLDCPYHSVGCSMIKADITKMKSHFMEEDYFHARLLMKIINSFENEIVTLKADVGELRDDNSYQQKERDLVKTESEQNFDLIAQESKALVEDLETIKLNDKSTQETIRAVSEFLVRLSEENASLRKEVNILKSDNKFAQESARAMDRKIEDQAQVSKRLEKELNESRKLIDRVLMQNKTKSSPQKPKTAKVNQAIISSCKTNRERGEFTWLIKNWADKRNQAKAKTKTFIRSDPFYSHEGGYHLCLDIHPNGSGNVIGTYLSASLGIMNGKFDKKLDWPFRPDVKLDLMNHETGLPYLTNQLDYSDSPSSRNGCYKNIAFRPFIPLAELDTTPALCRNNQIWIRVTVEVPQNHGLCGLGV